MKPTRPSLKSSSQVKYRVQDGSASTGIVARPVAEDGEEGWKKEEGQLYLYSIVQL